ncbi:MAG: alpha/beta fold hydrolase [Dehalococcoidia bacterium]
MAKRGAVVAGAVGAGVAAALASFNLFMKSRGGVLPSPVEAAERWVDTDDGRVRVYEAGSGAPLVLLHSFNAAASTYEMRPLFEAFAPERRVIAFDWLGFGLSERPALRYSAETYQRLLERVLDRVLSGPADVIALSLPSQYVAIAAGRRPERFRRIICLSPTGFGRFTARGRPSGVIATALLRAPSLVKRFTTVSRRSSRSAGSCATCLLTRRACPTTTWPTPSPQRDRPAPASPRRPCRRAAERPGGGGGVPHPADANALPVW